MPKNVLDALGGDIIAEANQHPIEELDLYSITNKKGEIYYPDNMENIFRIITKHPSFIGVLRFNAWTNKKQIWDKEWRNLEDNDYIEIQGIISTLYPWFCKVNERTVRNAVIRACNANTIDPGIEYLRNLPEWDGCDRLSLWIYFTYGTEYDVEYHAAVGSNFFKGMVARILHPGCKFDTVLVLHGKQAMFKSTSLKIIAGEWHAETALQAKSKDFLMTFSGKLIVEFSEGATINRSDTKQLKSIISTPVDTYRAPYGSESMDIPRRCVFAMTTNDEEFLKDETGNRRFLPVEVKQKADIRWLEENRDQLFAEALYRYEVLKETTWEYPDSASEYQEEKMISSGYEEKIMEWMNKPVTVGGQNIDISEGITVLSIYEMIWPNGHDFNRMKFDITKILKKNGYHKSQITVNGVRGKYWRKTI